MRTDPRREAARFPARNGTGIGRRRLLRTLPAAALLTLPTAVRLALPTAARLAPATAALLAGATRASAATSGTDLVLACDLTLGPAMRAAGTAYANATGVRVNVFPTGLGLILPQLEREVQNDIVVTRVATLDAAVQAGVVAQGAARGAWRNRLVIAAKRRALPTPDRPIAICDALAASDMDAPAILTKLQLPANAVLGVVDTDTVVALVLDGTARAGLMHMTDVRAYPDLEVVREVPDTIQLPVAYAAAVTKLAYRPDPAGMVAFLLTSQATALLAALGLEAPSS